MQRFIRKPSVDMLAGIKVDKDTVLEYKNDNVDQTLKDLVFHSITKVKGDNFESVYDTTIQLSEGLGDAAAAALVNMDGVRLTKIGIQDEFGQSGKPADLLKAYKLDAESIAKQILG